MLEGADKSFCIWIVGRCACSAHAGRELAVFDRLECYGCSVLTALVGVEDVLVLGVFDEAGFVYGGSNELRSHTVVKHDAHDASVPVVQHKAASDLALVSELKLEDVGEEDVGCFSFVCTDFVSLDEITH